MVTTHTITGSSGIATSKSSPIKNEEAFLLARDTLKKMPLIPHEIDSHGFPNIPGNLSLDQRLKRKKETNQYIAHCYATNSLLKEKLQEDAINNFNQLLKDISAFNPTSLAKQNLKYIISLEELRKSHIIALIHSDPLITLNLITGRSCGLYSTDLSVQQGALNMLIVLGKYAGYIDEATKINDNLIEDLSNLFIIRKILYKQMERTFEPKIIEHIKAIDNEFEDLESKLLEHCIKLKKEETASKLNLLD